MQIERITVLILANQLELSLRRECGEAWRAQMLEPQLLRSQSFQLAVGDVKSIDLQEMGLIALVELLAPEVFARPWMSTHGFSSDDVEAVAALGGFAKKWRNLEEPVTERSVAKVEDSLLQLLEVFSVNPADKDELLTLAERLGEEIRPARQSTTIHHDISDNLFQVVRNEDGAFALPIDVVETATRAIAGIGIDFGTSTTFVALASPEEGRIESRTLKIPQPDRFGSSQAREEVPTVLSFQRGKVFFGDAAEKRRDQLIEGTNVFSSFKMRLGEDLGPSYVHSELAEPLPGLPLIAEPKDAARCFFELLGASIRESLSRNGVDANHIGYTVTVPASFQPNQRTDLLQALTSAGLPMDRICLIDEPNAAFLATFHHLLSNDPGFVDEVIQRSVTVLIYDCGAGTSDVSVLEIEALPVPERVGSFEIAIRTLAISRFMALGGDDIDRWIAENVLMDQLRSASARSFTRLETEERIVPWLLKTAKRLKEAASRNYDDSNNEEEVSERSTGVLNLASGPVQIDCPTMKIRQLGSAIDHFARKNEVSFRAPIDDVFRKIPDFGPRNIDYVLFVGGTAQCNLVRESVMGCFDSNNTQQLPTPDYLQAVAQGAAIHSAYRWGLGVEVLPPIVSETISVTTRNGEQVPIIRNGMPLPFESKPVVFITGDQPVVQIPLCSGSVEQNLRILSVVEVKPAYGQSRFRKGDRLEVTASLDVNKDLRVVVLHEGAILASELVNPMANRNLTQSAREYLKLRREFNRLQSGKKLDPRLVVGLAKAALQAREWELAGDLFVRAWEIDPNIAKCETYICYAYGCAKMPKERREWARRSYDRNPNAINTYNYAINLPIGPERCELLDKVLKMDPNCFAAICVRAVDSLVLAEASAADKIGHARSLVERVLSDWGIPDNTLGHCRSFANRLQDSELLRKVKTIESRKNQDERPYDSENLASAGED